MGHVGPPARRSSFVPALGFHWLTGLYDPMVRAWSGMARMRRTVIDSLELRPGMRLLELGAGAGRLAIEIKRRHPEVVIEAIDADRSMVSRARRNAVAARVDVEFREADMTAPLDLGTFDRVYSTMVFHHLSPGAKVAALSAARDVLGPGGQFVVGDFSRPRGPLQWALFAWIQQPLDGFINTQPHRDGRYERAVRDTFADVRSAAAWKTIAGSVEVFVCTP